MADKQTTKQAADKAAASRTTSETLRLSDERPKGPKKGPSFQITSVTRVSTDAGDDSADDLDESHTESRATDLETPSFSEDASFSRDDIFAAFGQGSVAAPVIPTSAQYGLALVAPGAADGPQEAKEADHKDQPCRNDRFKVRGLPQGRLPLCAPARFPSCHHISGCKFAMSRTFVSSFIAPPCLFTMGSSIMVLLYVLQFSLSRLLD